LGACKLLGQENPVPARLAKAISQQQAIELLDVEVRHRRGNLWIRILCLHCDDAFPCGRYRGAMLERLYGVLLIARSIARLKPELPDNEYRHSPALEDAAHHVAVRRQRRHRPRRHLLEHTRRHDKTSERASPTWFLGRH